MCGLKKGKKGSPREEGRSITSPTQKGNGRTALFILKVKKMCQIQKWLICEWEVNKKYEKNQMKLTKFQEKVYNIVRKIPRGQVLTYKEIARLIGRPLAYRAVGNSLNKNPFKSVPCHRIIRSDGKVGGYAKGNKMKVKLLKKEGYL